MKTKYELIHNAEHPSHPYTVKLLFSIDGNNWHYTGFSIDGNNWHYTGFGHFFKTKEEAIEYIMKRS